ncbi:MAG: hypothetical protein ACI8P3_003931 [Saprospiraceae bacterium]|jgi:hypothetical protein
MNRKDDFYIGWQDKAPESHSTKTKHFVWLLFVIVPLVAAILVLSQKGFTAAVFEYGVLTEMEGVLIKEPVPMLKVLEKSPSGGQQVKSIVLVGFGKLGAEATIAGIEEEEQKNLTNQTVKLRGTRIFYDNKTLLELSEGPASFAGFGAENKPAYRPVKKTLGDIKLRGEIYDPKCAFGVMKPGYGKPHRSCAIRCISGGVPSVLRVEEETGETNYFLLLDKEGKPLRDAVLEYVADQVQICGKAERQDDWLVLYLDPQKDILRLQPHWMEGQISMCGQ